MEEEEAKTKWCPMSRLYVGNDSTAPYNRYLHSDEYDMALPGACKCVASDCMMWAYDDIVWQDGTPKPDSNNGHCGLINP